MLMSHAARSAVLIALPSLGPSALTCIEEKTRSAIAAAILGVDMLHLPFAVDRPAGDAVVMLIGEGLNGRSGFQLAALRDEFGARRLRVAGLVPGAALQDRGPAVPAPRSPEPGSC